MKSTILDAVQSVLADSGKPMDVNDIHRHIIDKNLFAFKAKDPIGVIRKVLRRHAIDGSSKDVSTRKYFRAAADSKFELVRS